MPAIALLVASVGLFLQASALIAHYGVPLRGDAGAAFVVAFIIAMLFALAGAAMWRKQ